VEDVRSRHRSKKTWTEVVEKDYQIHQLHKEDAVDNSALRKLKMLYSTYKDRE